MRRTSQRKFERIVALFFLPLLLLAGGIELVLWRARETWPIKRAAQFQREHPGALFMRGLMDQGFFRYKLHEIRARAPKILVLGSSRVMEFRQEMFGARAGDFYNAGGMIQDLGDLLTFARTLSNNVPEVIILGLDLWWFNENLPVADGLRLKGDFDGALDWQAHVKALRRFKSSKLRKPALQAAAATNDHIGLEARNALAGFRLDGSMHYNLPIPTNWAFIDREKPPVAERIKNQTSQFLPQRGAIDARLALLETALALFTQKGARIAGYLPPFSAESAARLAGSPGHSNLWHAVQTKVPALFARKELPFINASITAHLGLDDAYLIDGMHAAETLHLHLLTNAAFAVHFPGLAPWLGRSLASPRTNPWQPEY